MKSTHSTPDAQSHNYVQGILHFGLCIYSYDLHETYFNGKLNWAAVKQVCDATLRITSMVMFILLGSTAFSLVFRGLGGDRFMEEILTNIPGGAIGFLLVNMLVIFFLGHQLPKQLISGFSLLRLR